MPGTKICTSIPLKELRDSADGILSQRGRDLSSEDITAILNHESSKFLVADVGLPFNEVSGADRFPFWKDEVKPRLWPPNQNEVELESYPGEYCYRASEFISKAGDITIVLEKHH